ncbi:hypothetical protein BN440_2710 [Erwinia amylovora MR1]|nr:hypothetical protein BN440_2710 [Erwinia amylovora MR1]
MGVVGSVQHSDAEQHHRLRTYRSPHGEPAAA